MRPAVIFISLVGALLLADGLLALHQRARRAENDAEAGVLRVTVSGLGLTDLCLATEARYTRHPAVSDPMAPFMDHPGALEHFPTGSFWARPEAWR